MPNGVAGVRKSANVEDRVTGGRLSEKDRLNADGGRSSAGGGA